MGGPKGHTFPIIQMITPATDKLGAIKGLVLPNQQTRLAQPPLKPFQTLSVSQITANKDSPTAIAQINPKSVPYLVIVRPHP